MLTSALQVACHSSENTQCLRNECARSHLPRTQTSVSVPPQKPFAVPTHTAQEETKTNGTEALGGEGRSDVVYINRSYDTAQLPSPILNPILAHTRKFVKCAPHVKARVTSVGFR